MQFQDDKQPLRLIELKEAVDKRGSLSALEFENLPFTPVRLFVTRVSQPGQDRGGHSHRECWQCFYVLAGKITITVISHRHEQILDLFESGPALVLPPGYWSKQHFFTGNEILCVLASHKYDPTDYVYGIE